MENAHKEAHRLALKKTSHWQIFLLTAMGFFYGLVVLLVIGEFATAYYQDLFFFIGLGVASIGLAWAAYLWSNLWRTIKATRTYLRLGEENDLLKAYQQQRLFWRNISIITGLFISLIVVVFIVLLFSYIF